MSDTLKPSYERGGFKKKNYYKQVDGDVVFRIIPPLSQFTRDPRAWARFHAVHFGYKNTEGKMRCFESTLEVDNKTKMVKTPDPAVERIDNLKAALKKAEVEN